LSEKEREIILETLDDQRSKASFFLFAFVVMPDHMHLLLSPNSQGLISGITQFKSNAAKRILGLRKSRGPLWQPRYFDNIVRRVRDFWKKLEYIHENPVNAELVTRAEDWRWSSINAYSRNISSPIAVDLVDFPADGDSLLWPVPWRR
jgi:putative transposase